MFRIVSRAIVILAAVATVLFGIWWALETTVSEIDIQCEEDKKSFFADQFNPEDYTVVIKMKSGRVKTYSLATIKDELEGVSVDIPESFDIPEDVDAMDFTIKIEYGKYVKDFVVTSKRGNFDDVKVAIDGKVLSYESGNKVTYTGKAFCFEFINLPEGTNVTAVDKENESIDYNSEVDDVGTYNVIFTFERDSYTTAIKVVTVVVEKKEIVPTLSETEFEFDGNPAEIVENLIFKNDGKKLNFDTSYFTVKIYDSEGNEIDGAISEGKYKIVVTDNGNSNYKFKEYEKDFIIYKEYRVTFRQKGFADNVVVVRNGEKVKVPAVKSVPGYNCEGWNWEAIGRTANDPVNSDFVVEAIMNIIDYDITFVIGDAEKLYINMEEWETLVKPTTYNVENAVNIPLPIPVMKAGEGEKSYYFDGWYDKKGNAVTVIPEGTTGDIILYAKAYEIYTYSYTYEGVEAVVSGRQPTIYTLEHTDKTADGYKFTGWTVKNAAGDVVNEKAVFPYAVNESGLQFISNYEEITYKIYLRGNKIDYMPSHPTVSTSYVEYNISTAATVDLTKYTASYPHCEFLGWFTEPVGGERVESIAADSKGDIHFYAHWEAKDVKVIYDSDDAENVTGIPATHTIKCYETLILSKKPSRNGYDFLGWSLDKTESGIISSVKIDTSNVSKVGGELVVQVYAVWGAQTFTHIYSDRPDGKTQLDSGDVTFETVITIKDFEDLGKVIIDNQDGLYEYQNHEGLLFNGWKILGDTSDKVYHPGDKLEITEDVTLVPNWEYKKYNITFNANTDDETLAGDLPVWTEETRYQSSLPIPESTLERMYYEIVGWSKDPNAKPTDLGVYPENPSGSYNYYVIPKEDTVLYAVWAPKSYTVTFDYNNADGDRLQLTLYYGDVITTDGFSIKVNGIERVSPENVGYTNLGWSMNGELFYGEHIVSAEVTFECAWEAYQNRLSYTMGYGTYDELFGSEAYTGDALILPPCTHIREFYEFAGWKDAESGVIYQAGEEYNMPGMPEGTTRELKAEWRPITYTIEFSIPGFTAPAKYTFNFENMIENDETGSFEYPLTYSMMGLTTGTYIFKSWKDANGAEIVSVTESALRALYAAGETTYAVDVDIEAAIGFSFEAVPGGYSINGYNGSASNLKLPTHHNGKEVTEISYGAFDSCTTIEKVTFAEKNNITVIGYSAFANCENLTEIVIPEEVVRIDRYAFRGCASSLIIKCEAAEKPEGFANNWNATGDDAHPEYTVLFKNEW